MRSERKYLVPRVIELNLQAGRPLGVNLYLVDGGAEWALVDVGQLDTLSDVIDLVRRLDFPLAKCKAIIATHADADHVQALAAARDRLKTRTAAHPHAAGLIEAGDRVQTYAEIAAQDFSIDMPPCKIDLRLNEGDTVTVGDLTLEVWHTPGHTPGQISLKLGDVLFSGDTIYADGCVGVIDAHHGSSIPDYLVSLKRVQQSGARVLLPSHGPAFRNHPAVTQSAIDRLTAYQYMADFGTCAVGWPLQDDWERAILAGIPPELS